jgi:uncharacterized protein YciI
MEPKTSRRNVLFYDYVEDIVARRGPHRPAHLELLREYMADGRILDGGALGDPPHSGMIVFDSEEPAVAEEFAGRDPYVQAGLVKSRRVEPWTVVS